MNESFGPTESLALIRAISFVPSLVLLRHTSLSLSLRLGFSHYRRLASEHRADAAERRLHGGPHSLTHSLTRSLAVHVDIETRSTRSTWQESLSIVGDIIPARLTLDNSRP